MNLHHLESLPYYEPIRHRASNPDHKRESKPRHKRAWRGLQRDRRAPQ